MACKSEKGGLLLCLHGEICRYLNLNAVNAMHGFFFGQIFES